MFSVNTIYLMKRYDDSNQFGRLLIAAMNKFKEIKTPADVARHLDITPQVLTNWKKRGLPAKDIDSLADEFDCNYKWLKTGEGDMHSKPVNFLSQEEKLRKDINDIINEMSGRELSQAKGLLEVIIAPKEFKEESKKEK